ncbi:hypothetical protein CAC42_3640 [Sphaceloma murrayae]|uniref:Uncharacterized protein n=1 Tax=Sphaceloma murrayae TaxID=2082308 RepID=A0A2K1QQ70_9PEZI|nr:hypothetical protein CAC42_3640 [Sphaceloma murrayae]
MDDSLFALGSTPLLRHSSAMSSRIPVRTKSFSGCRSTPAAHPPLTSEVYSIEFLPSHGSVGEPAVTDLELTRFSQETPTRARSDSTSSASLTILRSARIGTPEFALTSVLQHMLTEIQYQAARLDSLRLSIRSDTTRETALRDAVLHLDSKIVDLEARIYKAQDQQERLCRGLAILEGAVGEADDFLADAPPAIYQARATVDNQKAFISRMQRDLLAVIEDRTRRRGELDRLQGHLVTERRHISEYTNPDFVKLWHRVQREMFLLQCPC